MENILVLNNDYTPLNITDLKRAFKLVYKGKAEVVTSNTSNPIITELKNYVRPTIIRLLYYISIPFRKVTLNRENIFKRDNYECLYCGSKKNLTIDHVTPKSKGGKNTWKNLVTCCKRCNIQKDNKTLKQSGMELKYTPYRPTYIQFIKEISLKDNSDWIPYLG